MNPEGVQTVAQKVR